MLYSREHVLFISISFPSNVFESEGKFIETLFMFSLDGRWVCSRTWRNYLSVRWDFPEITTIKSVRWIRRDARCEPLDQIWQLCQDSLINTDSPRTFIYPTPRPHRLLPLTRALARRRANSPTSSFSPLRCRKNAIEGLPADEAIAPVAVVLAHHQVRVCTRLDINPPSLCSWCLDLFLIFFDFSRSARSVWIIALWEIRF